MMHQKALSAAVLTATLSAYALPFLSGCDGSLSATNQTPAPVRSADPIREIRAQLKTLDFQIGEELFRAAKLLDEPRLFDGDAAGEKTLRASYRVQIRSVEDLVQRRSESRSLEETIKEAKQTLECLEGFNSILDQYKSRRHADKISPQAQPTEALDTEPTLADPATPTPATPPHPAEKREEDRGEKKEKGRLPPIQSRAEIMIA